MLRGAPIEQRARLAALARSGDRRDSAGNGTCASMRAPPAVIERLEPIARRVVLGFGEQSLGDARLVRHDDREDVALVQQAHRVGGARQQSNASGSAR